MGYAVKLQYDDIKKPTTYYYGYGTNKSNVYPGGVEDFVNGKQYDNPYTYRYQGICIINLEKLKFTKCTIAIPNTNMSIHLNGINGKSSNDNKYAVQSSGYTIDLGEYISNAYIHKLEVSTRIYTVTFS